MRTTSNLGNDEIVERLQNFTQADLVRSDWVDKYRGHVYLVLKAQNEIMLKLG